MKAGNNGEEEIGMEKSKSMIEGRNEVSRQRELASSCTRVESEREGAMKSNLVRLLSVRVNDRERERKEGLESTVASLSCKLVRYYNRNGVSRLFGATTYAPMLSRYIVSSVEHWPCSYLNRN